MPEGCPLPLGGGGGGGLRGPPPEIFEKMVPFGAFLDPLGCFFKCFKTSCLWGGEIIFHSPHPPQKNNIELSTW